MGHSRVSLDGSSHVVPPSDKLFYVVCFMTMLNMYEEEEEVKIVVIVVVWFIRREVKYGQMQDHMYYLQ